MGCLTHRGPCRLGGVLSLRLDMPARRARRHLGQQAHVHELRG